MNPWLDRFRALKATAASEPLEVSGDTATPTPSGREPPPPDDLVEDPCSTCGSLERWRWLHDRLVCRQCLLRGDSPAERANTPIAAVKVWSEVLQEAVWVVADDLPPEHWPTASPVYAHREVKILQPLGPGVLSWVQTTKEIFDARVVEGHGPKERIT